jgi:hypothetical protein
MNRLRRMWLWVQTRKYYLSAAASIILLVVVWLVSRDKRKPAAALITKELEKAADRHDEVVVKAVGKISEARGTEAATRAQLDEIKKEPDAKQRRRRLVALLRSDPNG